MERKTENPTCQLISVKELKKMLSLSRRQIFRMKNAGLICSCVRIGSYYSPRRKVRKKARKSLSQQVVALMLALQNPFLSESEYQQILQLLKTTLPKYVATELKGYGVSKSKIKNSGAGIRGETIKEIAKASN